jgi:hypothetical protein
MLAYERRGETAKRLRHENYMLWIATADRADHGGRILGEAGGVVCRRKRDRDGFMPALLKQRRN